MNHDILREKIRKAFGTVVPFAARESWATFVKERRTEFNMRYEWIKDPRFYQWIHKNKEYLELKDGVEWFGVYICNPDGSPINEY